MAKIACEITYGSEENDNGIEVECTYAECGKCGHETMSFGTHEGSVSRCLALLNDECPCGESNFYHDKDEN